MKNWLIAAVMLASASALAVSDPNDAEGTADHPEVPRFPGYHIESASLNDFQEYLFPTGGEDKDGNPKGVKKGGKYWEITYGLNEDARRPSPVEVVRNYENAFKKVGGKPVFKDPGDGSSHQEAVFQVKRGAAERWVRVSYVNAGELYTLHIVDVGTMEQKVEVSANEMREALEKDGYIALHGILFDTGKADIKPASEPLLAEIVTLLSSDKALKLSVEGHTDNVGDKKVNLTLSKKRAESVMKYLVGKGIDAKRLKSDGKGDTVPVGDNRSEDGRSKNRRVELVKF
ncbi:OmpA family protein [Myxococcaceae bacterium GXIMD 01537]